MVGVFYRKMILSDHALAVKIIKEENLISNKSFMKKLIDKREKCIKQQLRAVVSFVKVDHPEYKDVVYA